MAYSPKLIKQRSCCYPTLDVGSWFGARGGGGRRTGRFARRLDRDEDEYYDDEELDMSAYGLPQSSRSRWSVVWRRIVKEKRRIFDSGAPTHEPYDEYSYAQNFDEGDALVEPENLSRSFSARFAAQPRMLRRVS